MLARIAEAIRYFCHLLYTWLFGKHDNDREDVGTDCPDSESSYDNDSTISVNTARILKVDVANLGDFEAEDEPLSPGLTPPKKSVTPQDWIPVAGTSNVLKRISRAGAGLKPPSGSVVRIRFLIGNKDNFESPSSSCMEELGHLIPLTATVKTELPVDILYAILSMQKGETAEFQLKSHSKMNTLRSVFSGAEDITYVRVELLGFLLGYDVVQHFLIADQDGRAFAFKTDECFEIAVHLILQAKDAKQKEDPARALLLLRESYETLETLWNCGLNDPDNVDRAEHEMMLVHCAILYCQALFNAEEWKKAGEVARDLWPRADMFPGERYVEIAVLVAKIWSELGEYSKAAGVLLSALNNHPGHPDLLAAKEANRSAARDYDTRAKKAAQRMFAEQVSAQQAVSQPQIASPPEPSTPKSFKTRRVRRSLSGAPPKNVNVSQHATMQVQQPIRRKGTGRGRPRVLAPINLEDALENREEPSSGKTFFQRQLQPEGAETQA